jgi:hypothetical protein
VNANLCLHWFVSLCDAVLFRYVDCSCLAMNAVFPKLAVGNWVHTLFCRFCKLNLITLLDVAASHYARSHLATFGTINFTQCREMVFTRRAAANCSNNIVGKG